MIHKPAGIAVPDTLIEAAAIYNADGWGVMGRTASGETVVERHVAVDSTRAMTFLRRHRDSELAIHLRRKTYGAVSACNAHPFKIDRGIYLMHNGSFDLPIGDPAHSDTWHLVHEILRPLAHGYPGLLTDRAFTRLLDSVVPVDNRLVLFDAVGQVFHIVNRGAGIDYLGLWISSVRWLDARIFPTPSAGPVPEPIAESA
ncbi:hypothetical protein D3260_00850 [Salinisphaera sp. Q1T1-3]|nr:hypothetical protein D3260_00850 [Salinisphaera sp. Q1T1-3]